MAEPFLGQISTFGFNFPPRGWATCDGQILAIATNTALFSLLGTTFGGNGQTTFALPDLRGRVPIHQGQGPGLSSYVMGEVTGVENVTLIQSQMPAHSHVVAASTSVSASASSLAPTDAPGDAFLTGGGGVNIYSATSDGTKMNAGVATTTVTLQLTGGSQPHDNLQPLLCINFCISLEGIFPSRN
jgi:microcystin-dependent protein